MSGETDDSHDCLYRDSPKKPQCLVRLPSVSEQQPEALIFCSRLMLCALSTPSLACLGYLTVIVRAALVDALYHVSPAKVA